MNESKPALALILSAALGFSAADCDSSTRPSESIQSTSPQLPTSLQVPAGSNEADTGTEELEDLMEHPIVQRFMMDLNQIGVQEIDCRIPRPEEPAELYCDGIAPRVSVSCFYMNGFTCLTYDTTYDRMNVLEVYDSTDTLNPQLVEIITGKFEFEKPVYPNRLTLHEQTVDTGWDTFDTGWEDTGGLDSGR